MDCPPAPIKKNRCKKIRPFTGQPKQLFHDCIIFKGVYDNRHILSDMCDTCRHLPINDTNVCSKKHKDFLIRLMTKDIHGEIDFKIKNHYLTFSYWNQNKVELLLRVHGVRYQIMHINDQTQNLEQEFARLRIHEGVDLEDYLEENPHSSVVERISTHLSSTDKLIEFNTVLISKDQNIPTQNFEVRNGQLFMNIVWPGVGDIAINVSSCSDGASIYDELCHIADNLEML